MTSLGFLIVKAILPSEVTQLLPCVTVSFGNMDTIYSGSTVRVASMKMMINKLCGKITRCKLCDQKGGNRS